jgi:hypothetical protein
MIPIRSIQIKWLLAAEFLTAKLNVGSNRKNAKISAAATVPSTPAILPNRIATKTMTVKNKNGKNVLNSVSPKTGIDNPAAAVHDVTPIDDAIQRAMGG